MESKMRVKYLITLTTMLLPVGLAQAQSTAPQATPAPSESASAPSAASPAEPQTADPASKPGTVQATPATDADLVKGKMVNDPAGEPVGTIDSTTDSGVVLAVGKQKYQIPKNAVGKNDSGLVTTVTKAQLEAASSKATSTKGS
jgi:hypothetical protein